MIENREKPIDAYTFGKMLAHSQGEARTYLLTTGVKKVAIGGMGKKLLQLAGYSRKAIGSLRKAMADIRKGVSQSTQSSTYKPYVK